jgi:hypothetical protein
MSTKAAVGNRLLAAREEGWKNAEKHALRPLGRLWGMDVFAWCNPSVYELSAAIAAFSFPVCWLGNETLVKELAQVGPQSMSSLAWCGQYDCAQLMLPGDAIGHVPLVTATETLEDTLRLVKMLKQPRHVLLLTAAGTKWKIQSDFEAFIRLNAAI